MQLTGERLSHFTTARANYITPHHTWESVCPCNGTSTCSTRSSSSGRIVPTIIPFKNAALLSQRHTQTHTHSSGDQTFQDRDQGRKYVKNS